MRNDKGDINSLESQELSEIEQGSQYYSNTIQIWSVNKVPPISQRMDRLNLWVYNP